MSNGELNKGAGGLFVEKIPKERKKVIVADLMDKMEEGFLRADIENYVRTYYPEVDSDYMFNKLVKAAQQKAITNANKDKEYVFHLHMDRYEKMYKDSLKMVHNNGVPLHPKKDWKIMIAKYGSALKALLMKEKLLGLHDKDVAIEINNSIAKVNVVGVEKRGPVQARVDDLTLEEKKELLSIIQEAKGTVLDGIHPLIIKQVSTKSSSSNNEVNEDIVDIEFEDIPSNTVDRMKVDHATKVSEEDNSSKIITDVSKSIINKDKENFLKLFANNKKDS